MKVLSLFDGMSCGQIALNKLGIKYDNYFASEIDKHAVKVAKHNYPNMIHIGDVTKVDPEELPKIDLLIGGAPCHGLSFAGKQLSFEEPRGKLFFECVRLLKECKPKYFLLENNRLRSEYKNVITDLLDICPIEINSALVSAQNRKRLYWTNIPYIKQPNDKEIYLQSILEKGNAHRKKSKCVRVGGRASNDRHEWDIATTDGRRYTRIECERLQTVPDNYTDCVSNTQRYKMLGNGWTVDVICHIFKNMTF